MRTIWKFPIETTDAQAIEMPEGAEILCIQTQTGQPCLWAEVDSDAGLETRVIEIFGTGHPMPTGNRTYIGTYQIHGGALIFHAYVRV